MFEMIQENFGNESLPPTIGGAAATARARRWLEDRIKKGRTQKTSEFALLTPELARLLLERNPSNRPIKEANVARYTRDIESGRYEVNGESVVVSDTGELNDGQNRCHAVLRAMKPIETLFAFGVSRESRTSIDQGSARTAGDYLGMEGIANCNNLAAIACKVIEIEQFGRLTSVAGDKPTKGEVTERVLTDPEIERAFVAVHKAGSSKVASDSVLGAAYYFMALADEDAADDFINKLITGTNLSARNPILVAREKLIAPGSRLTHNEKFKTIFTAWRHYRARKSVKNLYHSLRKGERLPEVR